MGDLELGGPRRRWAEADHGSRVRRFAWAAVARCLVASAALAASGCDSEQVDGSDLRGLFAPSASAPALAKATPSASPGHKKKKKKGEESLPPPPPATERERTAGPCLPVAGEPAKKTDRNGRRPACRRARVLEYQGERETPRYACVFSDSHAEERKPLPLVVFLHGELDDPTAVTKKTRLRARYSKLDMTGDPKRAGFVVLAPQARRFNQLLRWDVGHHARENLDAVAINHFIDELLAEGAVDPRQIYFLGESRGGEMAALYSHLFPERVAAFGAFGADASKLPWTCNAAPPPAAIFYRSCDAVVPCAKVERWLGVRDSQRAPTFSLRLGGGKATEPSCVLSASACGKNRGSANHGRWPKPREGEMLEYLSRFSFKP